jgi:hypothetical protein
MNDKVVATLTVLWTLLSPAVAGVGGYYKAIYDIRLEIAQTRLESAKQYAPLSQLEEMNKKLDMVLGDVREMKGYLKRKSWSSVNPANSSLASALR